MHWLHNGTIMFLIWYYLLSSIQIKLFYSENDEFRLTSNCPSLEVLDTRPRNLDLFCILENLSYSSSLPNVKCDFSNSFLYHVTGLDFVYLALILQLNEFELRFCGKSVRFFFFLGNFQLINEKEIDWLLPQWKNPIFSQQKQSGTVDCKKT